MTEKTSIVIDGNIDPLRAALREAAREMGRMADSVKDASRTINNETRELDNGFRRIPSSIGGIKQSLESLRNVVAGGVLVGFAGDVFKTNMAMESLQATLKYTTGSTQAADKEFAYIRETAKALGLELETAARAYIKLAASAQGTSLAGEETRKLFEALAGASVVMGLSATELEGALLAVSQMMSKGKVSAEELRGQLGERLPGAFNIAAEAMGVTTAELDNMLKTGEVLAEDFLPKLRAELERRFEPALEDALKSTRTQVNLLSTSWTNFKISLGNTGSFTAAAYGLDFLTESLNKLSKAINFFPNVAKNLYTAATFDPQAGKKPTRTATGKITGLPQQAGAYDNTLTKDDTAFLNGLKTAKERQAEQRRQLYSLLTQDKITIDEYNMRMSVIGAKAGGGGGGRSARQKAPPKEKDAPESFMSTYDARLEQAKHTFAMENSLREMSKMQEAEYWRSILDNYDVTAKDRLAITLKVQKLELESKRSLAQQLTQIDQIHADTKIEQDLTQLDELQAIAQQELDLGLISKEQLLMQERGFIEQRLALEQEYIDRKIAIAQLDPEKNLVLLEQLEAQKAEIGLRHQQQLADKSRQIAIEAQAPMTSMWQSMQSGFASVFQGILSGTMSIGGALRAMAKAVLDAVAGMLAQIAAKWLVNQIMQRVSSKMTALSQISANAGVAATAAMASVAAIPVYGWAMAPGVGAATAAAAMGYSSLAVAERGYDIPRGLNPLTQLHEEEMVLPKPLANAVRSMTGSEGAGTRTTEYAATRIINVLDPNLAADFMQSSAGEQIIINHIRANSGAVRQILT